MFGILLVIAAGVLYYYTIKNKGEKEMREEYDDEEDEDEESEVLITLQELESLVKGFADDIESLLEDSKHNECDGLDLEAVDYDDYDENERFRVKRYADILWDLDHIMKEIYYTQEDVTAEGILHLKENKAHIKYFELVNEENEITELLYGARVEVLLKDEHTGKENWIVSDLAQKTGVESPFLRGYPEVELEGIRARIRETRHI